MPKMVEGVYKDGVVTFNQLLDVDEGKKVIVIVDMTKEEIMGKYGFPIHDDSKKIEPKPFRIIENGFFAMPPEDLGEISEEDLDKIIIYAD